jgi:hypothetical protein
MDMNAILKALEEAEKHAWLTLDPDEKLGYLLLEMQALRREHHRLIDLVDKLVQGLSSALGE